jgi:hypothetical protein
LIGFKLGAAAELSISSRKHKITFVAVKLADGERRPVPIKGE